MAFESVRSYVQLASGLGEMTKARALEAAQGLLALPGADEVTRRAVQASTLADQLLEAAKANRDNLVALVQSEVEAALRRADVARLADVEAARTSLAAVTHELADLRATVLAAGVSAVSSASRSPLGARGRSATGAVSTRAGHGVEQAADRFGLADVSQAAAGQPTPTKAATRKSAATKSAARKSAAKKSTAKKSTAKQSAAKASAPSAAGRTAAKKATAKKSTAKKATAKKSTAKKSTAKKSTATTSTAKKATT